MLKNRLYWPERRYETVRDAVDAIAEKDPRLNQTIKFPSRKKITIKLNKMAARHSCTTYGDLLKYLGFQTWSSRCDDGPDSNIKDVLNNELGDKPIHLLYHHLRGKGLLGYFEPENEARIPVNFRF